MLPLLAVSQTDLLQQAINYKYSNPDTSVFLAKQIVSSSKDSFIIGEALHTIAVAQWISGNHIESLNAAYRARDIFTVLESDTGLSKIHNDIGLNFWTLKNSKGAMTNYLKALEYAEKTENDPTLPRALGNIGILYEEQQDYDKALEFQERCLNMAQSRNDKRLLANTLNNISLIYKKNNELFKAANFAKRCLSIRTEMNDQIGKAQAINLLGIIAQDSSQLRLADSLYQAALTIYNRSSYAWGQAMVLGNLGSNKNQSGDFAKGIEYCTSSYELSKRFKLEWKQSACKCLAQSHAGLGNASMSNKWWNNWRELNDSTYKHNLENDISLVQQRFEHEKIESRLNHEKELSEAEAKRQKLLGTASIGIGTMALILFFVLLLYYKGKQRDNELLELQNREISEQKAVIEEKSQHITDSIRYAQSLQQAILPKNAAFEGRFENAFIFYRPKDIVSGDFYWLEDVNDTTFIAVADCTGHGVPGAMVSMVGYQGLNKAVREKQLSKPSEILQSLSDHVEEQFEKSGGSVKDGMDIALIALSKDQKTLTFAGAHNPLLLVSKRIEVEGATQKERVGEYNMFEVKSDRRSIGGYFDAGPFTDHQLTLDKGDTLFMFSDGYGDQFGGEKGKKLGIKRLRQALLNAVAEENITSLESFFNQWKEAEEQIDDVALIALTV